MIARVTFDAAHDAEGQRGRLVQSVAAIAAAGVLVGVPITWLTTGMQWPIVAVAAIAVCGAAATWLSCAMGAVVLSEPLLRWQLRRQARAFGAGPGMAAAQLDAARLRIDEEDRARFAKRPGPAP
jgi:hypothetical protein